MALQRANAVRLARAALKRAIHDGRQAVADVVASCPPEAASMSVGELLVAQHRWGEARALRLLRQIPLSETKPVGSLTTRQRRALVEFLGGTLPACPEPSGSVGGPARPRPTTVPAVLFHQAARPGTTAHRSAGGTPGGPR